MRWLNVAPPAGCGLPTRRATQNERERNRRWRLQDQFGGTRFTSLPPSMLHRMACDGAGRTGLQHWSFDPGDVRSPAPPPPGRWVAGSMLAATVVTKASGGAPSRYHVWRCAGKRVRTNMVADLTPKCELLGSDADPAEERGGDVACQAARLFDDGGDGGRGCRHAPRDAEERRGTDPDSCGCDRVSHGQPVLRGRGLPVTRDGSLRPPPLPLKAQQHARRVAFRQREPREHAQPSDRRSAHPRRADAVR